MKNSRVMDTHISLAHGNGGRFMRELIDDCFAHHLSNPSLNVQADAVPLVLEEGELVFTTDGFTVQPLEFPGGDIGSLAVHGTTNDLAVAGATPRYLSLNTFIEEGFEIEKLDRIIASLAKAARDIDVQVAAGDTKVLPRGQGGGLYLATTGIGFRKHTIKPSLANIQAGDIVMVSGQVGDHGTAVMLAREQFGLHGTLLSDASSVLPLTQCMLNFSGLRFMRDPTRGGLATVLHEITNVTNYGVSLNQDAIPVHDTVNSVCEMLGYDPYYLACEGRVVSVISAEQAKTALMVWKTLPQGRDAAIIGEITDAAHHVVVQTSLGGERILEELEDDPLPRIC